MKRKQTKKTNLNINYKNDDVTKNDTQNIFIYLY